MNNNMHHTELYAIMQKPLEKDTTTVKIQKKIQFCSYFLWVSDAMINKPSRIQRNWWKSLFTPGKLSLKAVSIEYCAKHDYGKQRSWCIWLKTHLSLIPQVLYMQSKGTASWNLWKWDPVCSGKHSRVVLKHEGRLFWCLFQLRPCFHLWAKLVSFNDTHNAEKALLAF